MPFTETLVEDYIVEKLQEKGWKYVPPEELERESYEEPLLIKNLVRALKKVNADKEIGDEEIKNVLNELKFRLSGMEGIKQIMNFLKNGVPVKFEKDKIIRYVQLFDYETIENNEFIVSRQVVYKSGDNVIRPDIMLYVNGIPLVDIECKNPASFAKSWRDAYKQIKEYEETIRELYKYVQIGVAAEQIARYFPIVPWQKDVMTHSWREEGKDPIDSLICMMLPERVLDIIRNYLFFRIERGEATKVIARYMQYRAAEKIVKRVIDNLEGKEKKNKGLIWHWQGSGKTLTMIFAANKLFYLKKLQNPSIFFIVDRLELEEQLYTEFYSLDIVEPEIIGSISEMRKVLKHDEGRGKRGIMITLIHKFRPEELSKLQKELQNIESNDTIMKRKNVIAFIDEGHRTQYGVLAAQMKKILKNAFFFAFTGTPISKKGRDTYFEFCYPPEEPYLDWYSIKRSIEDGFTKKIVYQPRLEDEVHLKKDLLETFLEMEYEELSEDIREKVEERIKKKINVINSVLENPKRIEVIAKDIKDHFKENVDNRFKAMIVAASRKACVMYKEELDKYLPKNYSEIVMTYKKDDKEVIKKYLKDLKERYKGKDIEDINKEIVLNYKEKEFPKILIVTEMLLTGFDASILQTMYLDKLLKEHRLLQAIARTNRPYKGVKEAGVIIDYVGILKEFKKAFEMYSRDDIRGALYNMNDIREEFNCTIKELLEIFKDIPKDKFDRKTLLRAVEILTTEEEKGEEFLKKYRALRKIFELLGSDELKLIRFSEYKWLSGIYTYYMRTVLRSEPSYEKYVQQYFKKTLKFIHKTTEIENIEKNLPMITFDENYLKNLEEKIKSKEEKAANIVFTLNRFILVDRYRNPIYESVADKVERILKLWKEKTKDFEEIYIKGTEILREIEEKSRRKKELGLSDLEYSILLYFEDNFGETEHFKEEIERFYQRIKEEYIFPGWISQASIRKKIERETRRFARQYVKKNGLKYEKIEEIYRELIKRVETYG